VKAAAGEDSSTIDLDHQRMPKTKGASMTRSRSITFLTSLAAIPLAVLALAACGGSNSSASPPTTSNGGAATLGVANTGLGDVLVNSQGRTLYLFQKDSGTQSTCSGACASNWPPLQANGKPTEGSGADASMVGTTMRSDGKPQVTYHGHPLYLFEGDQKPGDTKGEGVNAFGANWYAVSPAGNQVVSSPNSGGGYGY
jgi:predicted lipoprotein with Yx(FWY)xxD motif